MHKQFLLEALKQAWLGRGMCAPNPSVGAVAVRNGKIIAQSWHRGAGTPHAEQLLLAQIPPKTPGVTLYVTLEPCNHWGKTAPCVDIIIKHGIERVVYAYCDPNPVVAANDTPALLRKEGIDVLYVPLAEIDDFYYSYRHWTLTKMPVVTAKIAQTLDGKIAGANGARISLSNELCAEFTHKQRQHSDVILTTAKTINQDNPRLNVRLLGETTAKPVAIIDSSIQLSQKANVLTTGKHCHIYHSISQDSLFQHPNCSFYSMPRWKSGLDLASVLSHLGSLGYHDVWVEAGGCLFSALHRAKLLHRTYLYIVPRTLGSEAIPAYQDADLFKNGQIVWEAMGDNMIARFDWQEGICSPD